MASFQDQYGIRLSREAKTMRWGEFCDLLAGISPDTPLGRIVAIRAEDDPEVLKQFTPEQRRIRNRWRTKQAEQVSEQDLNVFLKTMQDAFAHMAGGGESG